MLNELRVSTVHATISCIQLINQVFFFNRKVNSIAMITNNVAKKNSTEAKLKKKTVNETNLRTYSFILNTIGFLMGPR